MSALKEMPPQLPDRLEPGTQNIPGIAGLAEGLRFVRRIGIDTIAAHERQLIRKLDTGLRELPEVRSFSASDARYQSGVLSFLIQGMDCERLADDFAHCGIAVRAGLHCAPLAHKTMGTMDTGTIRVSVSAFSNEWEIRAFLETLKGFLRRKNG